MQLIDKILPSEANNKYLGNRIALFGLIFTTCLMTWRSCVHLLYQDAGLNSIGSFIIFEGIPDPNQMIYMLGSVWGLQQLIFCECIVIGNNDTQTIFKEFKLTTKLITVGHLGQQIVSRQG